jgi:hypothetical protein
VWGPPPPPPPPSHTHIEEEIQEDGIGKGPPKKKTRTSHRPYGSQVRSLAGRPFAEAPCHFNRRDCALCKLIPALYQYVRLGCLGRSLRSKRAPFLLGAKNMPLTHHIFSFHRINSNSLQSGVGSVLTLGTIKTGSELAGSFFVSAKII